MHEAEQTSLLWHLAIPAALALAFFLGLLQSHRFSSDRRATASFSGGVGAAYVFLHLLPELRHAFEHEGRWLLAIPPLGFALFYYVEHLTLSRDEQAGHRHGGSGSQLRWHTRVWIQTVYAFLTMYTLVEQLPPHTEQIGIFTLALCAHFFSMGLGTRETFEERIETRAASRSYLLGLITVSLFGGSLFGFWIESATLPVDVFTAAFAGFALFNVFHEEVPHAKEARFWWLVAGMLLVSMSHVLA